MPGVHDEHLSLERLARFDPAIQGAWQVAYGYIPCRLLKNISYSALGIFNNPSALELFGEDTIVCHDSIDGLVDDMLKVEHDGTLTSMIRKAQDRVRREHTYVNRIDELLAIYMDKYEK